MGQPFSNQFRRDIIRRLSSQLLDVLVIGGGATGAGILLDATVRGMTCGMVEMQDFAAGTSSRSTKLVHGGLRYLKQLEVRLVAEVGRERVIVYENGPHVTTPEWMLLPIVEHGRYGKWATSLGISLYDFLARVKRSERRQMLSARQALALEPLLNRDILKGAGRYVEYRTDDARLTLEVIKAAAHRGALALNYCKVVKLLYNEGLVAGAVVEDVLTGEERHIYARKVVNATGPWVDQLREMDASKRGKTLHLTKGVHIVVSQERFPLTNPVYFDVPDGRMIFAIPRDGKVYVGTTDSNYDEDLVHPRMTTKDLQYLLTAIQFMFPSVRLKPSDIESSWAGVRPLIHEEGKGPSEISRKDEIFHSQSGLITIAGGKLTGYRKMAEQVVNRVAAEFWAERQRTYPRCTTEQIRLSGGDVGGGEQFQEFVRKWAKVGVEAGLSSEVAQRLVRRYGSNIAQIYGILAERSDEAKEFGLELDVYAAVVYGVENEMVYTLEDFFTRRTGSTYFNIAWARARKEPVARYLGKVFNWSEEEGGRQLQAFENRLREAVVAVE